jgi:hypothetical protein
MYDLFNTTLRSLFSSNDPQICLPFTNMLNKVSTWYPILTYAVLHEYKKNYPNKWLV